MTSWKSSTDTSADLSALAFDLNYLQKEVLHDMSYNFPVRVVVPEAALLRWHTQGSLQPLGVSEVNLIQSDPELGTYVELVLGEV